ncbi:biorientation of chromosomes in cell division protein 1-like 1 [Mizuhopecten yessoensis]|uniref:Biorientation of chromosomes in cell division protein 1 n=1 Tax=Mizuhopecten yessoensis TaxID=6573 RepID=A0A210Q2C3_MIZYE|nr:biorientation of chromosomes in cell division protein 1-like 1 [Mizuhopecten yessoensis]OWF42884.1 Biorientation of chromosomes in cell division protein 1 [Mizuhopecten yessoensis]
MTTKKVGNETEADPKVVHDILDKLKSQGLFDQFRKECLADVDTKPAFQNLRQRVEGYVSRFLTRQVWSPNMNKNHLRDSLRRQINQSGMLATGVERVIEQVVNPKIFHVIKPKIDEVACQHLNIDPEKRKERMELKKNQQKQNLQSLMSLSVPPPDFQQQQTNQQPTPLPPQSATPFGSPPLMAGFPQTFTANAWQQQTPQQSTVGSYPPGMMSFPMAMPLPLAYGMPPQAFPYMPNPWGGFTMPNIYTKPPGFDTPSSVGSEATVTSTNPPIPGVLAQFGVSPAIVQSPLGVSSPSVSLNASVADTPTPPKTSLPPLPPIPKTPPPPGTEEEEEEEEAPVIPKDTPKQEINKALFKEEKNILEDIPLPAMPPTPKKKEDSKQPPKKSDSESVVSDFKTSGDESSQDLTMFTTDSESMDTQSTYKTGDEATSTSQNITDGETKRPYTFEWNREVDQMSEMSELSVSSVHTSDLSLFSEGGSNSVTSDLSDDDIPAPCYSPHHGDEQSAQAQDDDEVEENEMADSQDILPEVIPPKQASSPSDISPASSPVPAEEQITSSPSEPGTEKQTQSAAVTLEPQTTSPTIVTESPKVSESAEVTTLPKVSEPAEVTMLPKVSEPAEVTVLPKVTESSKVSVIPKVTEMTEKVTASARAATPGKPRRLISLQYNYSDSDDEETREERKARIAREKEERYVQRLQRRAELEARRKDREEEKAKLREERKKSKDSKKEEEIDKDLQEVSKEEAEIQMEVKCPDSPEKKKKKTKAELKEELTKQKVQEKKEALRRQRTRTRRYTSDEFTSIYTEKKQPFSSQSYEELVVEEMAVEETIETETVETDFTIGMMVDITPDIDLSQGQEVTSQAQEMTSHGEEVARNSNTTSSSVEFEDSFESPPTPTQDETVNENQIAVNQDTTSIPIFEVHSSTSSGLGIGQSIHQTRSRGKVSDDIQSNSSGRAVSPMSDLSDTVKSDTAGDGRRTGKRKRVNSGERQLSVDTDTRGKRGRVRLNSSPTQALTEDLSGKKSTDTEKLSSKRYDTSDLYKPHRTFRSSRRHGSSPGATHDTVSKAKENKNKVKSSLDTSPISSRSTSPVSLIGQTSPISSSSASFSSSRSPSKSKSRSRSNSSSSSGSLHSRSSKSNAKKSASGSSSTSSVDEFGRRKRKNLRMPIDMVDFGEAARLAKSSLINVDFGEAERWVQQQGKRQLCGRGGNQGRPGHQRGAVGQQGRGQWHNQGATWTFPMEAHPGSSSPPQSPLKHFYPYDTIEKSPSPHSPRPESPPYPYPYRGRDTPPPPPPPLPGYSRQRSESPIYRSGSPGYRSGSPGFRSGSPGYRSGSPGFRSGSPAYRRPSMESPPHYSQRSPSPSQKRPHTRAVVQRPISPDDCIETISSSSGSFDDPPSPSPRSQRSASPSHRPVIRGHRPTSPSPGPVRGPRSPSPPLHLTSRGQRPPSPTNRPITRGPRSPSPGIRSKRPPSPPSPPLRVIRGPRSPSPPHPALRGQRPPSPPSRPLTRGQISPSPIDSPPLFKRQRPLSPPSRPLTRGQRAISPPYMEEVTPSTRALRSQRPPSPPMMSQRLRNKHTAPDRFSPPPIQRETRRQRPPSPPPPPRLNMNKKVKR